METYQTEEQQVEAIKNFWRENGNSIIAGLVIGLSAFVGFGYYQEHKLAEQQKVADEYMAAIELVDKKPEEFVKKADSFISKNADSSYVALTALTAAKVAVDKKDYQQAIKELQVAIDKAPNEAIKAIATLRLAHVQTQLKQYDQALATLSAKMPASFAASVAETKGDLYVLQGKKDLARDAYQAAIDADGLKASQALQMKIDDLAVAL